MDDPTLPTTRAAYDNQRHDRIVVLTAPMLCDSLCLLCRHLGHAEALPVYRFADINAAVTTSGSFQDRTVILVMVNETHEMLAAIQTFLGGMETDAQSPAGVRPAAGGRYLSSASNALRFIWVMAVESPGSQYGTRETMLALDKLGIVVRISAVDSTDVLQTAIAAALRGRHFTSPSLRPRRGRVGFTARANRDEATHRESTSDVSSDAPRLSARQLEIANLAAGGKSNDEIGASLFISAETVKWHLNNVFHLLGIRHRSQIASRLADPVSPPDLRKQVK